MSEDVDLIGLVAEVRRILEVEVPVDPAAAAAHFDDLVATCGRARCAVALSAVAPLELGEIMGLSVRGMTLGQA